MLSRWRAFVSGFILFEEGGLSTLEWCPQQRKWQEDMEQPPDPVTF